MTTDFYRQLKKAIIDAGYEADVRWAEEVADCESSMEFFREYAYVVCNSGMKQQIARKIYNNVMSALLKGGSASDVFGHKGKARAIDTVFADRSKLFTEYKRSRNKLEFLASLPWIGQITKFHLAKNFGVDCVKPDRHLVRIAKSEGTTPDSLCRRISEDTGERLGLVDLVIWRAANLGLV